MTVWVGSVTSFGSAARVSGFHFGVPPASQVYVNGINALMMLALSASVPSSWLMLKLSGTCPIGQVSLPPS